MIRASTICALLIVLYVCQCVCVLPGKNESVPRKPVTEPTVENVAIKTSGMGNEVLACVFVATRRVSFKRARELGYYDSRGP